MEEGEKASKPEMMNQDKSLLEEEPSNQNGIVEKRLRPNGSDDVTISKETVNQDHLESGEIPEDRDTWGNKAEFLLSCIGLSVGIGNVWRFPYLAYKNGGGCFLFVYTILLFLVGKPLFFAELIIGQFTSQGSYKVWRCFPLGRGIGVAMALMSTIIAIYYNVIMTYCVYYMAQSFRSVVPWADCYEWWGADDNCYTRSSHIKHCWDVVKNMTLQYKNDTDTFEPGNFNSSEVRQVKWKGVMHFVPTSEYEAAMDTCQNGTQTASGQFFNIYVLQKTSGIEDLGTLKFDLVLTLFACWLFIYAGLCKGIRTSGKVVYFTATFPYVILITLVIYGCTLSGAGEGLKYFFIPDWRRIFEIGLWRAAAEQLLFSLGLGWGCLIMFASYNKFDNALYKDALLISTLDFATSLMSGIVIFSVLGHMSVEMDIEIRKVTESGPGLTFVTYPEALATLPVPQLWSVLFFFMLFLLAVDSEFSFLENVFTVIYDQYPQLVEKRTVFSFIFCMILFLLGLPCVTQGGHYVLNLMDVYGGGYAVMFIATFEAMALFWGYGAKRFSYDTKFMIGFRPNLYWRICWTYFAPTLLLFVVIYSMTQHKVIELGGVQYPMWAEVLGWVLCMICVVQIPFWAIVELYKNRKDWKAVLRPDPQWGPFDLDKRKKYEEYIMSKDR